MDRVGKTVPPVLHSLERVLPRLRLSAARPIHRMGVDRVRLLLLLLVLHGVATGVPIPTGDLLSLFRSQAFQGGGDVVEHRGAGDNLRHGGLLSGSGSVSWGLPFRSHWQYGPVQCVCL